jgi:hypothetical protein
VSVAAGVPVAVPAVLAAKAGHVAWTLGKRKGPCRNRLIRGSALSMIWGLGCAAMLWALLPTVG